MTAQRTDKQLLLDTGGPPIKVQQAGIDVFWGTLGEIIPDMWLPRKAALLHSMLTKRCKTNPTCTLLTMAPQCGSPSCCSPGYCAGTAQCPAGRICTNARTYHRYSGKLCKQKVEESEAWICFFCNNHAHSFLKTYFPTKVTILMKVSACHLEI